MPQWPLPYPPIHPPYKPNIEYEYAHLWPCARNLFPSIYIYYRRGSLKMVQWQGLNGGCYCVQKCEFHQPTLPHYPTLNFACQLLVPASSRAPSATTKRPPIALRAPISIHLRLQGSLWSRKYAGFFRSPPQYPYIPMINLNTGFNLTSSLAALNP